MLTPRLRYLDLLEGLVVACIYRALLDHDQTGLSFMLMRSTFAGLSAQRLDDIASALVIRLPDHDRHWWLEEPCFCNPGSVLN
jgi:hypothetical protein